MITRVKNELYNKVRKRPNFGLLLVNITVTKYRKMGLEDKQFIVIIIGTQLKLNKI
jgi:hypothetical protein